MYHTSHNPHYHSLRHKLPITHQFLASFNTMSACLDEGQLDWQLVRAILTGCRGRVRCLRRRPCHYASHQSLGWQMEALECKTASVGGTKVKRRIATLLRVRKSEAVIINGDFLPWEFIIVFDCSLLGLHNMQFDCPDCSLRASLVSDLKIPWL